MQGIPGSGKSVMADLIAAKYVQPGPPYIRVSVRSTDELRMHNGVYKFVPEDSGKLHHLNQKLVIEDMQANTPVIIVDNTNITKWEAEPYLVMAKIYEYDVQIVRVEVRVETAIARQLERPKDRRIPEDVIWSMYSKLERLI